MKFSDILKLVGDDGPFQRHLLYFLFAPLALVMGLIIHSSVFMVYTPDHWCHVPQLADKPLEIQKELIRPLIIKHNKYDSCHMYDIDYDQVSKSLRLPDNKTDLLTKKCDNGWVYDKSDFTETAATKVS